MSWDDEDFEVSTKTAPSASWEDEGNDDPLLESWDVDEEEEAKKKKQAEAQKKAELKQKQDEAKAKKNRGKSPALLDVDTLDEDTRQELLKKAQLSSDLNNAADLFGSLGVAGDELDDLTEHPRAKATRAAEEARAAGPRLTKDTPLEAHPLFMPANKQEFEKLRKALGPAITQLAEDSLMNYSSSLAVDLIRDVAQPLLIENIRKVVSTLNTIIKDKERAERQTRLLKSGGTATGGAGKKKAKPAARPNMGGAFKKDPLAELDSNYDDFADDDFM